MHDPTVWDNPEVIQDLDDNVDMEKDDEVDDEISYLGTSQLGQPGPGKLPANTDTAPVVKTKKQKYTKPKAEDRATEAAKRKADH